MVRNENLGWGLCLALLGCTVSHDDGSDSDGSTHDANGGDAGSSDGGTQKGCDYDGKHHAVGDSFPSSDGCNSCSCTSEGMVACTARACVDAGGGTGLHWYKTCGAPVCGPNSDGPTGQPLCTSEKVGDSCSSSGKLCDPSVGCGANLVCAASDPTRGPAGCPISRARYKEDIRYLNENELSDVAARLLQTPLAEWRYKDDASRTPQMGFIIEDVEPSPSVAGDHVNLYGYTSMAVAALKVQSEQLRAMNDELAALRARLQQLETSCPSLPSASPSSQSSAGSVCSVGARSGSSTCLSPSLPK